MAVDMYLKVRSFSAFPTTSKNASSHAAPLQKGNDNLDDFTLDHSDESIVRLFLVRKDIRVQLNDSTTAFTGMDGGLNWHGQLNRLELLCSESDANLYMKKKMRIHLRHSCTLG